MIPLRQGVSLGRLDQAEIANVAGERRLSYLDAALVQAALQVFLARDRSLLEQPGREWRVVAAFYSDGSNPSALTRFSKHPLCNPFLTKELGSILIGKLRVSRN